MGMVENPENGPFHPDRAGDLSILREALHQAGYRETAVTDVLEGRNDRMIDVQCAMRRSAEPSPFHCLVRLFILGAIIPDAAARLAVFPADLERLIAGGVIKRDGDGVRATARLAPWRDFLLFSDFIPAEGEPLRADFVMSGASPSSVSLTRLTFRNPVVSALDVGTGAGIHALLAAAHAKCVVATDTNARALNFAAMNARLNAIENVSFKQGSFFEPVAGERFDLIVSNPPFIVSPESSLMFQSPGMAGDGVSQLMVRESPRYLNEGGCAISLISWHHQGESDWFERPRGWAAGSGCDCWLLRASSQDPLSYAANALRQTVSIRSASYAEQLDRWVDYYRFHKISRLALGAVILRKRQASENWLHCENLAGAAVATDAGPQIQRMFAAEDVLAEIDDEALLDRRVALHPDHLLEQKLVAGEGGWVSQSLVLVPANGIEHRSTIDTRVLFLLSQCHGARTVREMISSVGESDGTDFAAAADSGLPLVKRLLRAGLLVVQEN
jgi:SAM-dependent methyltransferase